MDPNERLLSRVLQERSGHHRPVGVRSEWLLVGAVVLVVAAAAAGFRLVAVSGADDESLATDRSTVEALTITSPEPTAENVTTANVGEATAGTPVSNTTAGTPVANTRPHRYVVQPGDSLESIAERNGVRPATLASVNGLNEPDLLQPGRELVVPARDGLVHIVERGETLRLIAERYDLDVATLASANDLPDPDHIVAGLRLFIPASAAPG